MSIYIGTTEITSGKIYVGNTPVKEVYVGTTKVRPGYKTYTIVWQETNTPGGFFVQYLDDAAGLTKGSTEFDKFFGYYGCRLSNAGTETATVSQSSPGTLDITQLGTLTSGDNVMIAFPVRGIKMSKSGSTVTLSITDATGRESEGYQYYAFQNTGDIEANASTTVATKPLYLGAYLSYNNSSVFKSWSGQSPTNSIAMGAAITYASNNGIGWTIMGWYQRCLINAYYMMKYGNPNSKTVIGKGYTDASNTGVHTTGGTNSQTNATYGSSNGTVQCKLFGIEDWRGNLSQWVGGMFTDASKNMYVALHDFTANMSTSETQYKNAGVVSYTGSYYCLSSILGNNKGMFGSTGTVNNSSYNTYYCTAAKADASRFGNTGGHRNNNNAAGALKTNIGISQYGIPGAGGTRLMYL